VRHVERPALASRHPVQATLRVTAAIGGLRTKAKVQAIRQAMRAAHEKRGDEFRVLQFSVQETHVHLIVEAKSKEALSRGLKGFEVRVARKLNAIAGGRGGCSRTGTTRGRSRRRARSGMRTPACCSTRGITRRGRGRATASIRAAQGCISMDGAGPCRPALAPSMTTHEYLSRCRARWRVRSLISPEEIPGKVRAT